jgi:hypothetical protein
MVGAWAPWRKVSSANVTGRARPISATCSRGSCRVKAKSSGPRGSVSGGLEQYDKFENGGKDLSKVNPDFVQMLT